MRQKNDTTWITRDNLNVESFGQVVLDENIWLNKEYCQWKVELLWWLHKQGNVPTVREDQLNLLLNRFSDETIPAYFSSILEMIVFCFDELSSTTTELAINVIKNKTIPIDFDEHERIVNKIKKLPDHFSDKINILLRNVKPLAPLQLAPLQPSISSQSIGSLITPDNITILTALVSSIIGITTVTIKGIKLWIDDRASRKIKIKHKDFELEIQGGVSEKELRKLLSVAKETKEKLNRDNVQIIITNDEQPN